MELALGYGLCRFQFFAWYAEKTWYCVGRMAFNAPHDGILRSLLLAKLAVFVFSVQGSGTFTFALGYGSFLNGLGAFFGFYRIWKHMGPQVHSRMILFFAVL